MIKSDYTEFLPAIRLYFNGSKEFLSHKYRDMYSESRENRVSTPIPICITANHIRKDEYLVYNLRFRSGTIVKYQVKNNI